MSRIPRSQRVAGRHALPIIGVALTIGLIMITLVFTMTGASTKTSAPPAGPAPVPHFIDLSAPDTRRIVVVGAADETLPGTSNAAGVLMANLLEGRIPSGATQATVLSDSNCAPDADGISHCLNDLNVGGVVVTVQHHHAMAEVPCLSPGETVTLMTLVQYQRQL